MEKQGKIKKTPRSAGTKEDDMKDVYDNQRIHQHDMLYRFTNGTYRYTCQGESWDFESDS